MKKPKRSDYNSKYEYTSALLEYEAYSHKDQFVDKNVYEKFSAPPELWERLKQYCKDSGTRPSHFVQEAIEKLLNDYDY